jgi:hypothetical protein
MITVEALTSLRSIQRTRRDQLPKVVKKKTRTLTPDEYVAIVASLPAQHRLMIETALNTDLLG